MGRWLVPTLIISAMAGFTTSALTAGFVATTPAAWSAAVSLAVLDGITPMIYAVNFRIVPVFARRAWKSERLPRWQAGAALSGAWLGFGGRLMHEDWLVVVGSALAFLGGAIFVVNIAMLVRQPPSSAPPMPLPFPEQAAVDRLATRFTRLSGHYLLLGLGIALLTSIWIPTTGRWDLVWAHTMLLGFFLSMASGVSYHVLSRWTGRQWRSVALIRLHLQIVKYGLPLMLFALATDSTLLFAIAGSLLTAAIGLCLLSIAPMVPGLPVLSRTAIAPAIALLVISISLGAVFAMIPGTGPPLRLVHAQLNLFGWAGLLVCGVGYYLVPRFAGRPLRWPRLAPVQLGALGIGMVLGAWGWIADASVTPSMTIRIGGHILLALGFGLFGIIVAGTFRPRTKTRGVSASLEVRRTGVLVPRG